MASSSQTLVCALNETGPIAPGGQPVAPKTAGVIHRLQIVLIHARHLAANFANEFVADVLNLDALS